MTIRARDLIGSHDVLFITLDTLRHDVACEALSSGRTPVLQALLPGEAWERRHTSSSFTYGAHHAFFAGFLPTPTRPGIHPRLFAASFPGSETTVPETYVFEEADLVSGLRSAGYHTICIGGVGFFNRQTSLGSVLPDLFDESHWSPELGVTERRSTENQVALALDRLERFVRRDRDRPVFLFLNVSALHQPNRFYVEGAREDTRATQAAALEYVDRSLAPLFDAFKKRASTLCIVCSDHGTAYGEDGYEGHRVGHEVVWTVPYAEFVLQRESSS